MLNTEGICINIFFNDQGMYSDVLRVLPSITLMLVHLKWKLKTSLLFDILGIQSDSRVKPTIT